VQALFGVGGQSVAEREQQGAQLLALVVVERGEQRPRCPSARVMR